MIHHIDGASNTSTSIPRVDPPAAATAGPSVRPDLLAGEQFPAPPSQERSRRARESLLAAALSWFAQHGYDATTVDDITKMAGVAVGGFYIHFRSKRQVLLVLTDRLLQELDSRAVMARTGDMTTLMARLRTGLEIDWSYAGAYRAWREAALRDSTLAGLHAQIEAWTAERIAAALRSAIAAPDARRQIDVATYAWILSVLFWRAVEAPAADREPVANIILAFLEHILFE